MHRATTSRITSETFVSYCGIGQNLFVIQIARCSSTISINQSKNSIKLSFLFISARAVSQPLFSTSPQQKTALNDRKQYNRSMQAILCGQVQFNHECFKLKSPLCNNPPSSRVCQLFVLYYYVMEQENCLLCYLYASLRNKISCMIFLTKLFCIHPPCLMGVVRGE